MLRQLTFALALTPTLALAVGFNDDTPPKPTETTEVCENGQVWDTDAEACVDPDDTALNDEDRLKAVRELAYAGQTNEALRVLNAIQAQTSDGVMTYRGFLARQSGNWDAAKGYYAAALAQNPDNLLARSYLGQGHVKFGDINAARAELVEIRARGGQETWSEKALEQAIKTGLTPSY